MPEKRSLSSAIPWVALPLPKHQAPNYLSGANPSRSYPGISLIFYVADFVLPVGLAVHDVVGEEVVPPYSIVCVSVNIRPTKQDLI